MTCWQGHKGRHCPGRPKDQGAAREVWTRQEYFCASESSHPPRAWRWRELEKRIAIPCAKAPGQKAGLQKRPARRLSKLRRAWQPCTLILRKQAWREPTWNGWPSCLEKISATGWTPVEAEGSGRESLRPGQGQDRILEFLAVRKLNPPVQGQHAHFAGPPAGVGKTSLGLSPFARAIGPQIQRLFAWHGKNAR